MRLNPVETSTVLLGLRLVEICRTEQIVSIEGEERHLLDRPEFRDYDPTLPAACLQALRDRINMVQIDV